MDGSDIGTVELPRSYLVNEKSVGLVLNAVYWDSNLTIIPSFLLPLMPLLSL